MCSALRENAKYVWNYHWILSMKQLLFGGILSGLSLSRMVTSQHDITTEAKMERWWLQRDESLPMSFLQICLINELF